MNSNRKPYFSIIIPALNEEKYLPLLLRDLVAQTNQDFEVIIVDGQSNDKTVVRARKFIKSLPIEVLTSPRQSVCIQRNLGAKKACSSWLLFMDADNRLPHYFIQGLRYQIDKENPDFFITQITPDGNHPLDKTIAQVINTFFQTQKNTKKPYLLESMLGIKKSLFSSSGGFNESIMWDEGGELIKRLNRKKLHLTVFKEPKYTYSFRRIKKEGALIALRNSAYLILAKQTGITIDPKTYQKYYPMLGGGVFEKKSNKPNPIENIIIDLLNKYKIPQVIDKLNQPISIPKNPFAKLFPKLNRR